MIINTLTQFESWERRPQAAAMAEVGGMLTSAVLKVVTQKLGSAGEHEEGARVSGGGAQGRGEAVNPGRCGAAVAAAAQGRLLQHLRHARWVRNQYYSCVKGILYMVLFFRVRTFPPRLVGKEEALRDTPRESALERERTRAWNLRSVNWARLSPLYMVDYWTKNPRNDINLFLVLTYYHFLPSNWILI